MSLSSLWSESAGQSVNSNRNVRSTDPAGRLFWFFERFVVSATQSGHNVFPAPHPAKYVFMFNSRRLIVMLALLVGSSTTMAAEPSVVVINRAIETAWQQNEVAPAAECSDQELARRLYLDLAGRIPTPQEVAAFTANESPDNLGSVVDQLLASEDYVHHFADTFDTLLMGRTELNKYNERRKHQWRAWLERVFRENRPWNTVVADILAARPDSQDDRGLVWFLYERNNDHQKIAEAIAPAFFGIRIECAQCHDHMIATEIEQAHYWGLVAFFNRGTNQNTPNGPRVAESAIGGFSEFANLEGSSTPNLLTFFQGPVVEETRPATDEKQEDRDELYRPASIEHEPRVPEFSRREQFVQQVVNDHPLIPRAFVNRLWAMLLGRGIVHPFDEMDSVHDPSHPELLDTLTADFQTSGFDIRRLVRAIVLSNPYRLSSKRPDGMDDPSMFAWYLERPLTAEQLSRSIAVALMGIDSTDDETLLPKMRQALPDVMAEESVTRIKDALFLSNNPVLNEFIANCTQPTHLIPRLQQQTSESDLTTLLFQTIFARTATHDEHIAVIEYLGANEAQHLDRLQQVVWAMLTSAEFRFNH